MIIKDITAEQISTTGTILPFKKNIFPNKINKTIEIVIVPKLVDITANQKNVGIVLDGKSLGRIDIKMDHRGVPHFIEANLMPGLRKDYFYRSCLLNLNMSYEQMILTVADNGTTKNV